MPHFDFISLNVDPRSLESGIINCYQGNRSGELFIRISQSQTMQMIIKWNLVNNSEIQSYDCDVNDFTFYDSKGNLFLAHDKGRLTDTTQNVALKVYNIDYSQQKKESKFNLSRGQRMDSKHQNWICFFEYISLSFSFMTLVMRDHLKDNLPPEGNLLDREAYNFTINKQTFLTCDSFVALNSEALKTVLCYLEATDPDMLHLLNFYHYANLPPEDEPRDMSISILISNLTSLSNLTSTVDRTFNKIKSIEFLRNFLSNENKEEEMDRVTPLKIALANNRSKDIILRFMSKIDVNASETIKNLFP